MITAPLSRLLEAPWIQCFNCLHNLKWKDTPTFSRATHAWLYLTWLHTGCPISKFPLCFCHFLGFWSTYRGTSDLYSTALEICYMIGTRILKIDLEIAEIIEVKVGTRQFWNWHFAITQHPKNNFGVAGANFDLNYLSYFWINFQNSCGYHVANFQGCWIQVRSSSVRAPEPEKLAKTKWSLTYGTPCRT